MHLQSLFLAILLLVPAAARAQFVVDIAGGREVSLAVARPLGPEGEAKALEETLRRDLDISGFFTLIGPQAQIDPTTSGIEPDGFKMSDWSILKAAVLVKTRVRPAGDATCDPSGKKMCVDTYVYYVVNGEKLLGKRFRAASGSTRQLAHQVANEVLRTVTGRPGFFGIAIAAVGSQTGNKEIYVLGLDGKDIRKVTKNGSINLSPAWSPDGGSIAWTSYKKANPDLYVKNLRNGQTRVVSNVSGINASPAWSPDGGRLALARSSGSGEADIFVLDAKTGKQISQVTRGGGIDVAPNYSADGSLLAFASERSGGSQIYAQKVGSSEVKRLSFAGDFNGDPVISPDGEKIAYVARTPTGFDIVVADLDGRNAIRVTQDMRDNEDPSWSPDSQYLLFSSTRTGRSELWISTADGRHQVQITRTGGWTQPTFAPWTE